MQETERSGRSVLRAAAVAVVLLAVAELAAGRARPHLPSATAGGFARNPHYARGWPEYTRPDPPVTPRTGRLVIVISNSQGFLRERSDASEAWPSRLAAELDALGAPTRVLNWSMPGGNGAEMTLLAARAHAHDPDLIMLVSYNDNFGDRWRRLPLSYGYSDAHHLAYLPEVRARLPLDLLVATSGYDPLGWLGAHSSLLWLRNRWGDVGERWSWSVIEPAHRARSRAAGTASVKEGGRFTLLGDFLRAAGAEEGDGPALMVVGMPLCAEVFRNREVAGAFVIAAEERLAGRPRARVLNATALVPDEEFYGARHLRPAGHARFAAWLAPQVQALLAED
jgi:hypothetical protein